MLGTVGAMSVFSEDEAEELYADYIDEDSQRARLVASPGGLPGADVAAAMTNSSWRMMKWMRNYGELMRSAPSLRDKQINPSTCWHIT